MEARYLADPSGDDDPIQNHPTIVTLKRNVQFVMHEQRDSAEMFGKIMQTVTNVANSTAALDATVKTHLGHIDRRFDELRNDMLRQCVVRHNGLDGRIDKLESHDRQIERDVRTMSDDSKVHMIADLQAQLEEKKKKQAELAKEARENKTYWKRYRVTVAVGVLMAVLGAGLGYLSTKMTRPAPSPVVSPASSR